MNQDRYPSLREGIDFPNTRLIELFPKIKTEEGLAQLFQISGVSATIEDLRRILNNPNAILELTPTQLRAELLTFEKHSPDELVPLKRQIRNKLSYWEAVCKNKSQISVEEYIDGEPQSEVIAQVCVDVSRAIFANQKTEIPLVRVTQADLRLSVVRDRIRIPGKNPTEFVSRLTADLWVGVQVTDPGWLNLLQRNNNRTFTPTVAEQGLFSTPIDEVAPPEIRTSEDTIAIRLLNNGRVEENLAIGTRPNFTHLGISKVGQFDKDALSRGGLLTIKSYIATLTEGDVKFKGWGILHVASPDNLRRLLAQGTAAKGLASSAYLGFRGTPLPASCVIKPF